MLEHGPSLAEQTEAADGPLAALAPAERARAQALAAGTLRHLGRIDARARAVPAASRRRPPALNALRLAVAELHLDGVPAHAAVDGAVRLASGGKGRHLAGMVNAVARRVAEGGAALWDAAPGGGAAGLAGRAGRGGLGAGGGRRRSPRRTGAAAPIDLTLRRPEEAEAWAAALGAERLPTGSLRLAGRARVSGAARLRRGRLVGAGRGGGAAGAAPRRARRASGRSTSAPRRAARRCSSRRRARR